MRQVGSPTPVIGRRINPYEYRCQNIVNRHFKPLLKRAALPNIRWHDLRHTCATLLLGRGVHPKLVQHLLGHASITMTLDRYSHWIPSMGRHAAEGMDKAPRVATSLTGECKALC